jgi:hypothetical protein
MLRSLRQIIGYRIEARDGTLGRAKDCLFDDQSWAVRYLVVDTGGWLLGRQVLISPESLGEPDWGKGTVPVTLTKEQVEESPGVESHLPISRRHEQRLAAYYRWQPYWIEPSLSGVPGPGMVVPAALALADDGEDEPDPEPHLRSISDVTGYHIQATDGEAGRVADFLVQTEGWVIRYLVVNTRQGLPGRKILVSPAWVAGVDWEEKRLRMDLRRRAIRDSLEFDPAVPVNREYEVRLYDYYGRPRYWEAAGPPTDGPKQPAAPVRRTRAMARRLRGGAPALRGPGAQPGRRTGIHRGAARRAGNVAGKRS